MADPANTASDEAALARFADDLADGVEAALGPWVERSVAAIATAYAPGLAARLASAAVVAGREATATVVPEVRALLRTDVDRQATGPLAVLRGAVVFPTAVLVDAGVPPVQRDAFDERAFPEDRYGLSPASFADIDPSLHEPGLTWGAAKAHVVLARRRAEGLR